MKGAPLYSDVKSLIFFMTYSQCFRKPGWLLLTNSCNRNWLSLNATRIEKVIRNHQAIMILMKLLTLIIELMAFPSRYFIWSIITFFFNSTTKLNLSIKLGVYWRYQEMKILKFNSITHNFNWGLIVDIGTLMFVNCIL